MTHLVAVGRFPGKCSCVVILSNRCGRSGPTRGVAEKGVFYAISASGEFHQAATATRQGAWPRPEKPEKSPTQLTHRPEKFLEKTASREESCGSITRRGNRRSRPSCHRATGVGTMPAALNVYAACICIVSTYLRAIVPPAIFLPLILRPSRVASRRGHDQRNRKSSL
jgi:hypothetical protein